MLVPKAVDRRLQVTVNVVVQIHHDVTDLGVGRQDLRGDVRAVLTHDVAETPERARGRSDAR